jgi:hypothetical protein
MAERLLGLALTRLASSVLIVLIVHLVLMRVVVGMTISASLSPFGPAALSGAAAALAGIGISRVEPLRMAPAPLPLIIVAGVAAVVGYIVLLAIDHRLRSNVLTVIRRSVTGNPAGADAPVMSGPKRRAR